MCMSAASQRRRPGGLTVLAGCCCPLRRIPTSTTSARLMLRSSSCRQRAALDAEHACRISLTKARFPKGAITLISQTAIQFNGQGAWYKVDTVACCVGPHIGTPSKVDKLFFDLPIYCLAGEVTSWQRPLAVRYGSCQRSPGTEANLNSSPRPPRIQAE